MRTAAIILALVWLVACSHRPVVDPNNTYQQ